MKLNLNFDLYKGTTRLKQWWKEVKAHFTEVQEAHNALDTTVSTHKTAAIIDHPDKSITTEKIADESITLRKLSLDILKEIAKIPEFLYYEAEPVYLSGCKDLLGYELPADIPVNVLFIIENDTDSSLSEFRSHDDYYTPLSCKIPSGEKRICILLKRASGGADPQNGYLFVLDDTDTKSLINKETLERKNTDTTLQQNIDTEAVNRQTADNALDGRIAANESRIDAITLEIVDDNHIGNDGTTEVILPGKILQLNNRDDFSVSTELKIRYEINYENLYPDAIDAKSQTDLTSTESIYWMYVSSQQTGDNFGPDDDYYNFDTVITEAGKMYFKVISFAQHAVDGNIPGEIQVLAVVPPIPTTEAYIRTAETEDWTRLTNENELNAAKSDITALQQEITELQPHITDREIFVMCDGDHDELKIQAALDTVGVGGTVYPVGYTIALSNSNVVTSYVSGFKSILKIPAYVNLDFRYCSDAVVFYNDAPATKQILFDLGQNSTLSNVKIDIDADTVLSTSITPTLINTRTYCVIDNLTLYNWFGLSSELGNVYGIYVGQYGLFRNNNITNWNCGKLGSSQSLIRFEANTKLYDNTFDAITAEAGSGGNLFYFGLCTGSNNKFYNLSFGGSKLNVGSAYSFFSQNDFYKLTDARFSINGLWSCNMFRTLTGVNDDYMFALAPNAKMDNNKFMALTQSSKESVNCFSMSNAHFTNNQFISISISANTAFIAASSGIIANNLFNARNVSDTINIVECVNGAVVKDNCTNASSIGTYDSTCVVEGNVTGFGV